MGPIFKTPSLAAITSLPDLRAAGRDDSLSLARLVRTEGGMTPRLHRLDPLNAFPLRVITQRLTSTPAWQLPHVVPALAYHVSECRRILTIAEVDLKNRDGADNAVLVHQFKTQISTLLHDQSQEARYTAIVLIKASIEVGGFTILQGVGQWVKGLIVVLGVSVTIKYVGV